MKNCAPGVGEKSKKFKYLLKGGGQRRRKRQNGRKRNKQSTKRRKKLPRKFRIKRT